MKNIVIDGGIVSLRPFQEADISNTFVSWLNDEEVVKYSGQRFFLNHTCESCFDYLKSFSNTQNMYLAIEDKVTKELNGSITAYIHDKQGPAVNIFNGKIHKIEILSLDDLINKSDWLLCGTSWQSDLEWKAIRRAKKANKKVISFIDHWVNYRERYFKKSEYALPDEIWIGDIYAEKIAKDNFPNLKVMLKSNPYFLDMKEQLLKLKKSKNINTLLNKVWVMTT